MTRDCTCIQLDCPDTVGVGKLERGLWVGREKIGQGREIFGRIRGQMDWPFLNQYIPLFTYIGTMNGKKKIYVFLRRL